MNIAKNRRSSAGAKAAPGSKHCQGLLHWIERYSREVWGQVSSLANSFFLHFNSLINSYTCLHNEVWEGFYRRVAI